MDAISNLIIRKVTVNRNQSPKEVLNATGRTQYNDSGIVIGMPKGEGEETEVFFFKLDHHVNDNDLDKEYELRGLKPVDPYSLAKVNEDDSAFADTYPNGTHWKNEDGKWCFARFYKAGKHLRRLRIGRSYDTWSYYWWFAGVRK